MTLRTFLCCATLTLALGAYVAHGASAAQLEERSGEMRKKSSAVKAADKNTDSEARRAAPEAKTKPKLKTTKNQQPVYVAPDPKTLGLGCASGED